MLRIALALIICLLTAPAYSWNHGKAAATVSLSQIGVPALNQTGFPFMNFIKGTFARGVSSSFAWPSIVDANGYPNNGSIPAGIANALQDQLILPSALAATNMHYGWSGTGYRQFNNVPITITANNGCLINGSTRTLPYTAGQTNYAFSGTNCALEFFFTGGAVPATSIVMLFQNATYTNMAGEYLVRDSDWAAFQIGGDGAIYTPEFINFYKNAGVKSVRTMDWSGGNNTLLGRLSIAPPVGAGSYGNPYFAPSAWAGTTTFTEPNYVPVGTPSGWPGLVSTATVQAQLDAAPTVYTANSVASASAGAATTITISLGTTGITNGSLVNFHHLASGTSVRLTETYTASNVTGTTIDINKTYVAGDTPYSVIRTPMLNVGGTGNIAITNFGFSAISGGQPGNSSDPPDMVANALVSFMYDVNLLKWVYQTNGITTGSVGVVPYAIQTKLANLLSADLWMSVPILFDGTQTQALATLIDGILTSGLKLYIEPSNETWNNFKQGGYASQVATTFGWPNPSSDGSDDFYGAKLRQMAIGARAGWSRSQSDLLVLLESKAASDVTVGGAQDLHRFQGVNLVGATYPAYAAAGYADGNVVPNRPVDLSSGGGYAIYFDGAQNISGANAGLFIGGPNGGSNTGILGASEDYASGNSTLMANALAFMDWDARQGVVINSPVTSISSSGVVTAANFVQNGYQVAFRTSGTLDAAMTAGRNYYVINLGTFGAGTFKLSATPGGSALAISTAATGTITYGAVGDNNFGGGNSLAVLNGYGTGRGNVRGTYQSWNTLWASYSKPVYCYEGGFDPGPLNEQAMVALAGAFVTATVTFNTTSPAVNWTAHGLRNGVGVQFSVSGGAMPLAPSQNGGSLLQNQNRYVTTNVTTNNFDILDTLGGTPIALTSTGTGTFTGKGSNYSGLGTFSVGGGLDNLYVAYKQSALFQQLQADVYSIFQAQSQSKMPSQYGTFADPISNDQFALQRPSLFGTPWTSYKAICAFNGKSC